MDVALLSATHPTYDVGLWSRYDALYRGGDVFRQSIAAFLPSNPNEPPQVYQSRQQEAHYCGYVGPIVDWFAARLLSAPLVIRAKDRVRVEAAGPDAPDLEADSWYGAWKEDVDGVGTDLVDFLRARFTSACVKGRAWWLVELPDDEGAPAASRAEWEVRGLGDATCLAVENDQVLDWEVDARGQLEWAVVHFFEQRRASIAQSRTRIRETWRVYDRETVEIWAIEYDQTEQRPEKAQLVSSKPHGFERVPLVRLGFTGTRGLRVKIGARTVRLSSSALEGFWLMQRLAEAQIAHFRTSAALDWNIKRTCYAMPVFMLRQEDQPPRMGAGYYIRIGENEKVEWVAPPTEHLAVVGQRIDSLKDEIYRVGNQMAQGVDNNAAAVGRSADSKQADATSTEVLLRVYGALCREATEETYELLTQARGEAATVAWSVEGLDTFTLADVASIVEAATAAAALDIPSPTLRREIAYRVVDALLPGAEQGTRDAIRREIDERLAKAETSKPRRFGAPSAFGGAGGRDKDDMNKLRMDHRDDARRIALPDGMMSKIHVRPLGKIEAFTVWAVDGNAVRILDTDFAEGGNPSRYPYVPAGELWVDQRLADAPPDLAAVALHQALECALMADGQIGHEAAHEAARTFEELLRKAFLMGAASADTAQAALAVAAQWLATMTEAARALCESAETEESEEEEASPSSKGERPGAPDPNGAQPPAAAKSPANPKAPKPPAQPGRPARRL